MGFWIDFLISIPVSIRKVLKEFDERGLRWMSPLLILLFFVAVILLVLGSIQPLVPFIYSLI